MTIAASANRLEVVKFLAKNTDIDPNSSDSMNFTPLITSSSMGNLSIVKYLIEEAKADPNFKNDDSMTALMYCAKYS